MASRNNSLSPHSTAQQSNSLQAISTVRDEGKTYLLFRLTEPLKPETLVLSARTSAGGKAPSRSIVADGELVVVVPDMMVPLVCELTATSVSGTSVTVSEHVAPQTKKPKAGKTNAEARRLNLLDISYCEIRFITDLIIADGSENIVRGRIIMFPVSTDREHAMPHITVMGVDGSHITTDWVSLGDNRFENTSCPHEYNRVIDLSFRLPAPVEAFIVCVSMTESELAEGFASVDVETAGRIKGNWTQMSLSADADPDYAEWFERRRANRSLLAFQRQAQQSFAVRPRFSIIVPLYKTPLDFFREMADSVCAQSYPEFELLLINASPEDGALAAEVERYCEQDQRIRHIKLDKNYGITENTNAGIRAATGDFIAFFDHDDTLEPDILYWYAKAVSDNPDCDLLYCDEDHLRDGAYIGPFFKPDWDIDLLRSENYVCHMLCVRKSIVDGFDELPGAEFDGAQDHNMTFLVGEQARRVCHIDRILYHWRMHAGSTAGDEGTAQKSYALDAQLLAVKNHLARVGVSADVSFEHIVADRTKLHYHFDEHPLVSLVIPNKDAANMLERCINSITEKTTWPAYEIVIVENNSVAEETFALYERLQARDSRIRVVVSKPNGFNFSKLINDGFAAAQGEYLLMLNNDMELITADWLENMVGIAQEKRVGAVGAKLVYPDGTIQHCGVHVGRGLGPAAIGVFAPKDYHGYYENYLLPHQMSAVTGACLLVRRDVFEQVGGLDEERFAVNYNDIDYCMRVRKAGYDVVLQTYTQLIHYESVSRAGSNPDAEAALMFREQGNYYERWGHELIYGDPYYNKNFRVENSHYSLEGV
ncbi:MAG: glycosyltransferase family 2 protein [Atopobiaceae bacterium]|nr:glycosyltransferase family 2 protein [Atopobiaceae bacterium]